MREPDLTLSLQRTRGPIVYVAYQGQECLYVGRSFSGISRPFATSHHAIGGIGERVNIYFCASESECESLESELLRALKPSLNALHAPWKVEKSNLRSMWVEKFNQENSDASVAARSHSKE